ncbi:hypothetical protein AAG906_008116 [Vitis piasezkii]
MGGGVGEVATFGATTATGAGVTCGGMHDEMVFGAESRLRKNSELQNLIERGNYTNGSSYQANLSFLLTSFSNSTVDYGFYHSSAGELNGIGFCRGDIGPDKCRSCMNTSSHELRWLCPNSKEAIIYYDICTLRYSNRSIFGTWELNPHLQKPNSENFWDVNGSNQVLTKLLRHLQNKAASGGNLRKHAAGEQVDFETIYAVVQCSPDVPEQ